jgi:hypothetical protein
MLFSKAQFGLIGNTKARHFKLMSLRTKVLFAALICLVVGVIVATMPGSAATPSSGTLTDVSGPLFYDAGPFNVVNPTPIPEVDSGPECNGSAQPCDNFALTVTLPSGYHAANPNAAVKVTLSWTDTGSGASDYDLYIFKGTVGNTSGSKQADYQSASSANPEIATISSLADGSQKFSVKVVPFTPTQETVHVKLELLAGSSVPSPSPGLSGSGPGVPRFFNYVSPQGIADSVGEPSIGSNWKSEKTFSNSLNASIPNGGATLLFGGFSPSLWRNTFDDCSSPAGVLWESKPLLTANTPRVFGDPILFTDHQTGRTFVSQLEGLTPAGSTTDITDNDGDSFTPSEGSGLPSCIDHQTIGGGPFHLPLTGTPLYPNAVYYASQCVSHADASLSLDGGRTFGPASVMFTTADCGGLHGHLKVAPDGTAYVPNNACGGTAQPGHEDGNQAVIVSEDNGLTWSIRKIPGSTTKSSHDGSVGVATDSNTIYEGFQSGDGHPRIAVSHDKGLTWSAPFDVGATVIGGGPILNTGFAAVVAGDPNRASFAFYGTVTGGDDWNSPGFAGEWFLYVASTFDGGVTWTTQNLTPGDPIQRGGICGSGACRNHLDFFDATIDKEGRVVIGYTDGCVTATCINGGANDFTAKGTIARQTGGKRMFAANDPIEPAVPGAPLVTGSVNSANTVASLSWPVPDNGGSPITAYKISRGPSATGPFTLLATVLGSKNSYTDTTFDPAIQNFYIVTAVNAIGEGPFCHPFRPLVVVVVVENACDLPGLTILTDPPNDEIDMVPGHDVQSLRISEPFAFAPNKVVFTLKMQSLATVPPDTRWPVTFNAPNGTNYTVRMTNSPVDGATTAPIFQVGPTAGPFVAADAASNFNADGTITIVAPTSAIGNPTVGQNLTGFLTRIAANLVGATLTPDNMPGSLAPTGSYTIIGNASCGPTPPQCVEDTDPQIAYDNGWHTVKASNASNGTYHLNTGKDVQHALTFKFNLQSNTGSLQYFYATSSKGGTAQVLIDGTPLTVNYSGGSGGMRDPLFGASATYQLVGKGTHKFELVNLTGPAYVDRFCITNGSSSAQAITGPGTTTTSTSALAIGQSLLQNVLVPSNALGFSVAAEANVNVPYTLVVIDPSGKVLGTVNSSSNGIASVTMPVSTSGLYVIKLVNVGLGPVNIWTAATPWVQW